MRFKFTDKWLVSDAIRYGLKEEQGFFKDDKWKMLVEKYNATSVGKGYIEITLDSFEDLNAFMKDVDISSVEYIPYKATLIHHTGYENGGWTW